MLWFDVESKYEATFAPSLHAARELWFDVESKYEATSLLRFELFHGCGLM